MARVNINILGISEIKWTRIGKFNSDAHYIHYYGQESLKSNGVVLIVNKRVQNAVIGYSLKNVRMISIYLRQTFQYHKSKSMLKKLKLNGSIKTYKPF